MARELPIRATRKDASREKSLYYLLVTVGRQRLLKLRQVDEESARICREMIASLTVSRGDNQTWIIGFKRDNAPAEILIDRRNFKFYDVHRDGTASSTDAMGSNLEAANGVWDSLLANGSAEILPQHKKLSLSTLGRLWASIRGDRSRATVILFLSFPSGIFLLLATLTFLSSFLSRRSQKLALLSIPMAFFIISQMIWNPAELSAIHRSLTASFLILAVSFVSYLLESARLPESNSWIIQALAALAVLASMTLVAFGEGLSLFELAIISIWILTVGPHGRRLDWKINAFLLFTLLIASITLISATPLFSPADFAVVLICFSFGLFNAIFFGASPLLARFAPVIMAGPMISKVVELQPPSQNLLLLATISLGVIAVGLLNLLGRKSRKQPSNA